MPKLNVGVLVKLLICFAIPLGVLFMPIDSIPIDDLTLIQHRLLAIFLLAALLWGVRTRSGFCHLDPDHHS